MNIDSLISDRRNSNGHRTADSPSAYDSVHHELHVCRPPAAGDAQPRYSPPDQVKSINELITPKNFSNKSNQCPQTTFEAMRARKGSRATPVCHITGPKPHGRRSPSGGSRSVQIPRSTATLVRFPAPPPTVTTKRGHCPWTKPTHPAFVFTFLNTRNGPEKFDRAGPEQREGGSHQFCPVGPLVLTINEFTLPCGSHISAFYPLGGRSITGCF